MSTDLPDIPVSWIIAKQIDPLIAVTKQMPDGPFKQALLVRIEYYLDLIDAWKNKDTVDLGNAT